MICKEQQSKPEKNIEFQKINEKLEDLESCSVEIRDQ